MYFHIILELTQEASLLAHTKSKIYKYNETDLVKLSKRILIPLSQEKNVFFHHYIFEANQIENVTFKASKVPIEHYIEQLKKVPKYQDIEITEKMIVEQNGLLQDVTEEVRKFALKQ